MCRIFDFGVCKVQEGNHAVVDVPYFTMEMLDGQTLATRLAGEGPFTTEEAAPIVRQLLDGLSAIHAQGIVHRDFKPDNIFLVSEKGGPRVVITDFGLASGGALSRSLAGSGKTMGTLDYMSPEQLVGATPTCAFDIYALGVVMFELLVGHRPFSGVNAFAGAFQRCSTAAPLLSSVLAGADPTWERTIRRCLARDPSQRYATVERVRDDLFSARVRSPARRRQSVARGLASLGALTVFALWLRSSLPAENAGRLTTDEWITKRDNNSTSHVSGGATDTPILLKMRQGPALDAILMFPDHPRRFRSPTHRPHRRREVTYQMEPPSAEPMHDQIVCPQFGDKPINRPIGPDELPTPFASAR